MHLYTHIYTLIYIYMYTPDQTTSGSNMIFEVEIEKGQYIHSVYTHITHINTRNASI